MVLTPLPGIPLIKSGDNLAAIIFAGLEEAGLTLKNGDILVIAQKIISKSEGRFVDLSTIDPSYDAIELAKKVGKDPRVVELILRESNEVIRARNGVIIVEHRLGFLCANAGIDHSNVSPDGNTLLLLPIDPDASAKSLKQGLETGIKGDVGVLIIDSHGRPWRMGTVGVAIGIAGIPGLVDMRGTDDLFGNKLRATEVGVADELAAAASLLMGQADEGLPVIHVRGFPYPFRNAMMGELLRPKEMDLFR